MMMSQMRKTKIAMETTSKIHQKHSVRNGGEIRHPFCVKGIMNNGYYAVVLDKESRNRVRKNATMDVVNGDHITLAYKPDNRIFKKLKCLLGKDVDAYVSEIRANDKIEAFWVRDMYLTEKYSIGGMYKRLKKITPGQAHITISHKKDFKPGDAKSMFKKPTFKEDRLEVVQGKIKWIKFKNKEDK